jgi:hypothetical protein
MGLHESPYRRIAIQERQKSARLSKEKNPRKFILHLLPRITNHESRRAKIKKKKKTIKVVLCLEASNALRMEEYSSLGFDVFL